MTAAAVLVWIGVALFVQNMYRDLGHTRPSLLVFILAWPVYLAVYIGWGMIALVIVVAILSYRTMKER